MSPVVPGVLARQAEQHARDHGVPGRHRSVLIRNVQTENLHGVEQRDDQRQLKEAEGHTRGKRREKNRMRTMRIDERPGIHRPCVALAALSTDVNE